MTNSQQFSVSSDNTPRPHPDVLTQRMGTDVVLLHLRTNRFYELNHTAARFWELLGAGHTLQEIYTQMEQEFDVDATQLAHELATTLTAVQQAELVGTYA